MKLSFFLALLFSYEISLTCNSELGKFYPSMELLLKLNLNVSTVYRQSIGDEIILISSKYYIRLNRHITLSSKNYHIYSSSFKL